MKKSEDTKAKLINAAGEVFVERGFQSATVREICDRAGTPLGAMNYHFRDKQGLYAAVLEHSYQIALRKYPPKLGIQGGSTPEEKLRAFIHTFLLRLLDQGDPAWHMKLMIQEISDPTGGALGQLVESSIRPQYTYLVSILRELIEEVNPSTTVKDDALFYCAMSITGQCCHYYTGKRIIEALHPTGLDFEDLDRIADHITWFSLAGIRQLADEKAR